MTASVLPPGCLRECHCFENISKGKRVLNSQGLAQHCASAVLLAVHLPRLFGNNILETKSGLGLSCLLGEMGAAGWQSAASRAQCPSALWHSMCPQGGGSVPCAPLAGDGISRYSPQS